MVLMPDTDINRDLDQFLAVWGSGSASLPYDVGPMLSCTEVEALACLLDAAGQHDDALAWRKGHAEEDDQGDGHNPDGSIRPVVDGEYVADWEQEDDAPDCSRCEASNAGSRQPPHLCDVCDPSLAVGP